VNPLGTRARVEELARLLDGALSGPTTLTAGHAALATRLRTVSPALDTRAVPRAEFRAALRSRLVAVATVQAASLADAPAAATSGALASAVTWTQGRTAQRRLGITAGAMAGVIAFAGVSLASSRSLPGQPFYGLKRGAESLQLDLAHGDTAKGTKHLDFAATRLREARALADHQGELSLGGGSKGPLADGLGRSARDHVTQALRDFDAEATSGRTLLEKVFRSTGKPEPLRILSSFSVAQQTRLTSLIPRLPVASQAQAKQSLALVTDLGNTANELLDLGSCAASCAPGGGGPTLPTEPQPVPGVTASPVAPDNNVPPCTCVAPSSGQPEPTPEATTATPSEGPTNPATGNEPTPSPSPTRAPTSAPSPTPSPGGGIVPPIVLPTGVPTSLPTLPPLLPGIVPTALPNPLSLIPSLPPLLLPHS
jgi:hypothetical protein